MKALRVMAGLLIANGLSWGVTEARAEMAERPSVTVAPWARSAAGDGPMLALGDGDRTKLVPAIAISSAHHCDFWDCDFWDKVDS